MQFISQNIRHVITWWHAILIDEYQMKTWAKFNKNLRVYSQRHMYPPKINLIVLQRHV